MTFQKPVQGLRAFAVLAVLLNHLKLDGFVGGFYGVDIFFVISGYLITGLLLAEHDREGRISLAAFYSRRIRRIVPALVATVVLTVLAGFLLLSDGRFELLADSAVAALFSVSNIYFWSQVGYFDADAITKPLLHTWSLGVEEQFYLIWPILILLLDRLKIVLIGLIIVSAVSFFLSIAFLDLGWAAHIPAAEGFRSWLLNERSSVFYLMPFRVFEFGLGAILAASIKKGLPTLKGRMADALNISCLGFLAYAVYVFDEHSAIPHYQTLAISTAAALLIYGSLSSRVANIALGNRWMVYIGKLSYAIYLVHWPVIVFYTLLSGKASTPAVFALIVLTFLLACALHYGIEKPLRGSGVKGSEKTSHAYLGKLAGITAMAGLAIAINAIKDAEGRIPDNRITLTNEEWRELQAKEYCQDSLDGFSEKLFTCQNNRNAEHTVIAWGDSHSLHLAAGLATIYPDSNIAIAAKDGCIPQSGFDGLVREYPAQHLTDGCIERNHDFIEWAQRYTGEALVFLSSAKRNTPERISSINEMLLSELRLAGHPALVLGDFIRPGVEVAQCRSIPDIIISDKTLSDLCEPDATSIERELKYSRAMSALSDDYIPVFRSQCPEGKCTYVDDEQRWTYRDSHHLSVLGSVYEMKRAAPLIKDYLKRSSQKGTVAGFEPEIPGG